MRGRVLALLACAALAVPAARAAGPGPDARFLAVAAQSSRFELASALIAPLRVESSSARGLTLRLRRDHTLLLGQLAKLASAVGVDLPTAPSAAQRKVLKALRAYKQQSTRNGKSFDRAYAEAEIAAHVQEIAQYRREAASGRDPTVRAWARRNVGMLRAHLATARAVLKGAPDQ